MDTKLYRKWRSQVVVTNVTPKAKVTTKLSAVKVNGLKQISNVKALTKAEKAIEIAYISKKINDIQWEVDHKTNSIVSWEANSPQEAKKLAKLATYKEYLAKLQA